VKSVSRKVAEAQRKMGFMVDSLIKVLLAGWWGFDLWLAVVWEMGPMPESISSY
jgi:hypothetical protein